MSLRAIRAGALLGGLIGVVGCDALEQPPDERPVPREFASPTLTLGRSALPSQVPPALAPSASALPSGRPTSACCDALRDAAQVAAVEDQSALLFASLECDRMVKEKSLSTPRLQALTGTLPLPPSCR